MGFLFWKIEASRAIVLMAMYVFGLVSGWIMTQLLEKEMAIAEFRLAVALSFFLSKQ